MTSEEMNILLKRKYSWTATVDMSWLNPYLEELEECIRNGDYFSGPARILREIRGIDNNPMWKHWYGNPIG